MLEAGHEVIGYDNFSTGQRRFIENASKSKKFRLVNGDILDSKKFTRAMKGAQFVVHFAANADVRFGLKHPRKDLEQNTIATFNVLEAMRANGVKKIIFSSTGSIYGEPDIFPTPENVAFPVQTSLYGTSKLSCEGNKSYCEGFDFQGRMFALFPSLGKIYPWPLIYKSLLGSRPSLCSETGIRQIYLSFKTALTQYFSN